MVKSSGKATNQLTSNKIIQSIGARQEYIAFLKLEAIRKESKRINGG